MSCQRAALRRCHSWLLILLTTTGLGITRPLLANPPVSVVVSVAPLQTIVERVGGEQVTVTTMVRPGQSPHTYDPTPQQITALAQARVYVRIGVPFETAWLQRFQAVNPTLTILDARAGINLRHHAQPAPAAHDTNDDLHNKSNHHTDAPTAELDVHLWTSPRLVRSIAQQVRQQLAALDPAHTADYQRRQRAFDAELAQLDTTIAAKLRPLRHRTFFVYHPAWGYFADAYDLTQVAIEHEGKEPSARHLAQVIELAKQSGGRVIFVQPQINPRFAEQVAQAIGGRVATIDPLTPDYAATLLHMTDVLLEADTFAGGAP
ncbi:zinc ABC transporter substrate-binding protein [Rhodoferax sp. 4810]|uniref:High-affinity zinc uptake system protein ZnuA n=2 Tax=Thiospirillum jenense TaxID=1653858 RepID=A0A839HI86_9GAMM|nr:zinc ABC transporter substrate-binding protein [Rhodoferax jenense]MBB1126806.1 zinc ABC transporter substrate-binding protein [Thiospirillum jenense]